MLTAALAPSPSATAYSQQAAPGAAEALASIGLLMLPHVLQQAGADALLRIVLLAATEYHAGSLTSTASKAAAGASPSVAAGAYASPFAALGAAACHALPSLVTLTSDMQAMLLKAWTKLMSTLLQLLEELPLSTQHAQQPGADVNTVRSEEGTEPAASASKKKKKRKTSAVDPQDPHPEDAAAEGVPLAVGRAAVGSGAGCVDSLMGLLCVACIFEPGSLLPKEQRRLCKALLQACTGLSAVLDRVPPSSSVWQAHALRSRLLHAGVCALSQLLLHEPQPAVMLKHAGQVQAAVTALFNASLQVRYTITMSVLLACIAHMWGYLHM